MVAARLQFLDAGHFGELYERLGRICKPLVTGSAKVVDIGCGPGVFLRAIAATLPDTCALWGVDLSRQAIRRAATLTRSAGFVVADVFEFLPFADRSVDLAISMFSPRPAEELRRTMGPGSHLLFAYALPDHMHEVRDAAGAIGVHPAKARAIDSAYRDFATREEIHQVRYQVSLTRELAESWLQMGPNARHGVTWQGSAAVVTATVSVGCVVYRLHS